eukprot:TRINITY_DN231_c0_g1_i3.p1 TRINITY_DN231_c0_g1~~TRINITY_DN231_c0_g1_i3.p1  ORF type:complete len:604 (+),score=100.10 TRINITY_DN231_c0_g1_i3:60-1871(+)
MSQAVLEYLNQFSQLSKEITESNALQLPSIIRNEGDLVVPLIALAYKVSNSITSLQAALRQDGPTVNLLFNVFKAVGLILNELEFRKCSICRKEDLTSKLECNHGCCNDCWAKVLDRADPIVICPADGCDCRIPDSFMARILTGSLGLSENNQASSMEEMEYNNNGRLIHNYSTGKRSKHRTIIHSTREDDMTNSNPLQNIIHQDGSGGAPVDGFPVNSRSVSVNNFSTIQPQVLKKANFSAIGDDARLSNQMRNLNLNKSRPKANEMAVALSNHDDSISAAPRKCHFCKTSDAINKDPTSRPHCNGLACRQAHQKMCDELLECGHFCGGVRGETKCLGCVDPKCDKRVANRTYCFYCNHQLEEGASVTIGCGHNVHFDCLKKKLSRENLNKAQKGRILLNDALCPWLGCDEFIPQSKEWFLNTNENNQMFMNLLIDWDKLRRGMSDAALEYFEKNRLEGSRAYKAVEYNTKKDDFVIKNYAMLVCKGCSHIYVDSTIDSYDDERNKCEECRGDEEVKTTCKLHGEFGIVYKCRFCCNVASHLCWGTTHFCSDCHHRQCNHDYMTDKKIEELPDCLGKGKCQFWGHGKGKEHAICLICATSGG